MKVSFDAGEARTAAKIMGGDAVQAQLRVRGVIRHWGFRLQARVMARSSGRPGPRAVTGDYRRAWWVEFLTQGTTETAVVGNNKPQARRLNKGFVGMDSLGRVYDQPPYPHADPALDDVAAGVAAGLANAAKP